VAPLSGLGVCVCVCFKKSLVFVLWLLLCGLGVCLCVFEFSPFCFVASLCVLFSLALLVLWLLCVCSSV
jgi:hypothetical protein